MCCFALLCFVCLFDFACFFLSSFSLKHVYIYICTKGDTLPHKIININNHPQPYTKNCTVSSNRSMHAYNVFHCNQSKTSGVRCVTKLDKERRLLTLAAHVQRRVIVVCQFVGLSARFLSNRGCCRYQTWIYGYVQQALGTVRVWNVVVKEQRVHGGG